MNNLEMNQTDNQITEIWPSNGVLLNYFSIRKITLMIITEDRFRATQVPCTRHRRPPSGSRWRSNAAVDHSVRLLHYSARLDHSVRHCSPGNRYRSQSFQTIRFRRSHWPHQTSRHPG